VLGHAHAPQILASALGTDYMGRFEDEMSGRTSTKRRLAAILAADVVGYTRLMGRDEAGTHVRLKSLRREQIDPAVARHGGRVVKDLGDGVLVEFPSAVEAATCAIAVQQAMRELNAQVTDDTQIVFRIGLNIGDIIIDDGDIFGDGVNVAARLQSLCAPGGICVSQALLDQIRDKTPFEFDDLGEQQLKNVDRPVRAFQMRPSTVADQPLPGRFNNVTSDALQKAVPPPDKPSIAVLPFANVNRDPEQDYLSDGIASDIITALARLRWLFVIARNSTFVYKGKAVDVRQVARELGVRYVLEGSVRTAGRRIRITSQLVDAESAKHIWAQKYDRELEDVFAVKDEIADHVLAAVEPHLYAEEGSRAASQEPESVGTWGLAARALTMLNKLDRKQNQEAQDLLRRAIAMEPHYARAHALLSWAVWWGTICQWYDDMPEGYRQAAAHAEDALAHDPSDPWARMVSGLCLSTAGQHERALDELMTALRLNPSFALGSMAFGWALLRAGHFEDAIAETGRALRMSPLDSFSGFYTAIHGLALLGAERFEEALPYLRAAVAAFAEYPGHLNSLISCCGHLGRIEEAKDFIAARNRVGPPLRLSGLSQSMRNFAHYDVFVEGLRKAGVPE
jgi:adenylate cyclase